MQETQTNHVPYREPSNLPRHIGASSHARPIMASHEEQQMGFLEQLGELQTRNTVARLNDKQQHNTWTGTSKDTSRTGTSESN